MAMPPLEAKLVLDSTGFAKGIAQAGDTLNKFKGVIAAASTAVAGFLAYKATGLIREQMNIIDSTAKLADRLGVATEELTALQYAGDLAGVSSEQLQTSLTNLAKTMENAGSGSKAAVDSFAKIGLAYEDLINKSPQQQLELISDGLGKVESAGNRTAIALEIFGKSGAGMVNMLGDGSAALRETTKEAEELGVTFSRLDAAKVELANDALTKVGKIVDALLIQLGIHLSPLIYGVAMAFVDAAKSAGGFGGTASEAIGGAVTSVGVLYDAFNVVMVPINTLINGISKLGMSFVSVINDIYTGLSYFGQFVVRSVDLVGAVSNEVIAHASSLLALLKNDFNKFTTFLYNSFAAVMETTATAVGKFNKGMAESFRISAVEIRKSAETGREESEKNLLQADKNSAAAAAKTREAWSLLFNLDSYASEDVEALKVIFENLAISANDSAIALNKNFAAAMTGEGQAAAEDFWQKINEHSEKMAKEISDKAAAALAEQTQRRLAAESQRFAPAQMPEVNPLGKSSVDLMREELGIKKQITRDYNAEMESEYARHAEVNAQMWQSGWMGKAKVVNQIFGNLATLMQSHSKKAFNIGKAAAIAQTTINTAEAAMGAYKSMVSIPYVGPALAVAAAAAAVAAGAVQIQNIKGTQFGGGGSVSSAGGNIALVGGEPSGVLATQAGVSGNARNELNVTISGLPDNAMVSGQFVRELIEKINEAQADGSPILNVNMAAA